MAAELIILPAALKDLAEIDEFIGADDPTAADRYLASLKQKFEHLAMFPHLGRNYDQTYRYVVARSHLIFYSYDRQRNSITIANVVHSARDISDLLP